ncbi:hypothetical protein [Algoriphagus sp. AK58]|uniref:hypothetical protein n=1 Tax=Algoriphagus sp. AK58 TaxID=1406877 RepID=UPI00164EF56D|nr:hypothetical protein [Algoriphagus sp. AK58]
MLRLGSALATGQREADNPTTGQLDNPTTRQQDNHLLFTAYHSQTSQPHCSPTPIPHCSHTPQLPYSCFPASPEAGPHQPPSRQPDASTRLSTDNRTTYLRQAGAKLPTRQLDNQTTRQPDNLTTRCFD